MSSPLTARETKLIHVGPAPNGPHRLGGSTGPSKTLTGSPLTTRDLSYVVRHIGGAQFTLVKPKELGPMWEADKSVTAPISHIHRENWENRAGALIQNRGVVSFLEQGPRQRNPQTGDGRRQGLAESI